MSLRSKIVLTLTAIAVVYVAVDVFLMHTMVAEPCGSQRDKLTERPKRNQAKHRHGHSLAKPKSGS